MAEEQFFYRFRTLKNIFEYKELENLEIYFASNEELNDPMEAYKTVIFQGDNIMWHNLFKNYILCLSRFMLANELKGNPKELIKISSFNILNPLDDIQYTQIYFDLFIKIYKTFREYFTEDINNIFKENDKVTAEALKVYLLILNILILEIIGSHLYKKIINDSNDFIKKEKQETIKSLLIYKKEIESHFHDTVCTVLAKQCFDELYLPCLTNKTRFQLSEELYQYLYYGRFIDEYIEYLSNFVRAKSYIASFNTDATNPVMWSHYTENHQGVCLIYKNIDSKMELFKDENYTKTIPPKNIILEFRKVNYEYEDNTINFFYSFLDDDKKTKDNWYKDFLTNDKSNLYDNYTTNEQYIQNEKNLTALPLYKTKQWIYEKEYRLILNERNTLEQEDKKYKYDFKYLDGIIFGIKTPLNKKLEIIELIQKLCEKNNRNIRTFNFYQAFYHNEYENINYYELKIFDTPLTEHNNE
ncbi:MAG: DUF2971 domain-containing protein [Mucispirillum sp.]|nr:DUF2971 domain-containing protein [Mucispirillum sp.]